MERLSEELRRKIFDHILRNNPTTLFNLRFVSKTWKFCVDEYISSFGEWFKACNREIPKRFFNDIVEKIAPLSAYSWRDSFWMRSRSSNVPKDVYHIWKNSSSSILKACKFTELHYDSSSGLYNTFVIGEKYFVMSGKAKNNMLKTRIFDMQNISTPIRIFDCYSIKVAFFIDNNDTYQILLQLHNNCDMYMADFLANNELLFSGLRLNGRQMCIVIANECFIVDNDHMVITHYKFASGCFHPNQKITLPAITLFSNVHNIYIRGDELQVLLISCLVPGLRTVGMYRYKIRGDSSGKLSFTKNVNNFFEEISCNISDLSVSKTETACFSIANIVYIKSASLIMFDPVLYQMVNCFDPRGIPVSKDTRRIWDIPAVEISCAHCHSGYLVLGTNKGSVSIYEIKDIDDIIESVEVNATPPKYRMIDLKGGRIFTVRIQYIEGVLRVIARGSRSIWYIDFSEKEKYKC